MSYRDWLTCVSNFGEKHITIKPCPKCTKNTIKFQFVGDASTGFGSLYLWCDSCKYGIHVSSVKLPNNADVLPFNATQEEFDRKIPKYKIIND